MRPMRLGRRSTGLSAAPHRFGHLAILSPLRHLHPARVVDELIEFCTSRARLTALNWVQ